MHKCFCFCLNHEKKAIFYAKKREHKCTNSDVSRFSSFHDREKRISGVIIKLKIFEVEWARRGANSLSRYPICERGMERGNDLLCFTLMTAPFLFFYVGSTSSSLFSLWNMRHRYEHTATAKRTENRYSVASRTGVNPCKSSTYPIFSFSFFFVNANLPFIYSSFPPWKNGFFMPSLVSHVQRKIYA